MIAHCLFEQSGTFKNEFKKLGIIVYDYDILNDYGETDFKVDLFREIELAYVGGCSVFDLFEPGDGQEVLVSCGDNVSVDIFIRDNDGCYFEDRDIDEVTAWMPLPEPYKEGESE